MKQVTYTQNFRITNKSPKPEQVKQKRKSVEYQIETFEADDIGSLDKEKLAVVVNDALEQYAKKLFLNNTYEWDYVPSVADVNFDAVYADITAARAAGTRLITNASLAEFAGIYETLAVKLLSKSEKSAALGAKVIREKLIPIIANQSAVIAFSENLVSLTEFDEFKTVAQSSEFDIEAIGTELIEMLSQALDKEISADAL
jgi:hypothetical protein